MTKEIHVWDHSYRLAGLSHPSLKRPVYASNSLWSPHRFCADSWPKEVAMPRGLAGHTATPHAWHTGVPIGAAQPLHPREMGSPSVILGERNDFHPMPTPHVVAAIFLAHLYRLAQVLPSALSSQMWRVEWATWSFTTQPVLPVAASVLITALMYPSATLPWARSLLPGHTHQASVTSAFQVGSKSPVGLWEVKVKSFSHVRLFVTPMATRLLRPWDFPGKSTAVGCHFPLQEIFPTQRLNPGLPHCRQTLYRLSHQGRPGGL